MEWGRASGVAGRGGYNFLLNLLIFGWNSCSGFWGSPEHVLVRSMNKTKAS